MAMVLKPVVFIPGLWLPAESWGTWTEHFWRAGYAPFAEPWPGMPPSAAEARARPEDLGIRGIAEIVEHYAAVLRSLRTRSIVIGHSLGGLVAQILLGKGLASAAIAIDPAPMRGVLPLPLSTLRSVLPVLRNPANRSRAVSLTAEEFRYGFGNAVSPRESDELYRRFAIPGPGRPLFQAALANFTRRSEAAVNTANGSRGPLLLLAGERDHVAPPALARAAARLYRRSGAVTDLKVVPGRGHSLTIDHGWREVADTALAWLRARSLSPPELLSSSRRAAPLHGEAAACSSGGG
ncbi:MAG TPA: alpha/beta hydrolase [Anaeromyxobacteraceae bacterium]|nr:alpha/beta hydrolase [Anaeromyxobacteraceae bacterium]